MFRRPCASCPRTAPTGAESAELSRGRFAIFDPVAELLRRVDDERRRYGVAAQRLQERDEVRLLARRQFERDHLGIVTDTVRRCSTTFVVEIDHLLEGRECAVVHVRAGTGNVAQALRAELTLLSVSLCETRQLPRVRVVAPRAVDAECARKHRCD